MSVRIADGPVIPDWVRDHESFRRWARSDEFPEKVRLSFFHGDLWVEPPVEELFEHNQLKLAFAATMAPLVQAAKLGRYGTDGMLLSCPAVALSTVPDGLYYTFESLRAGRIRKMAGPKGRCTEFEGVPELVLEIVGPSSEDKDTLELPPLLFAAGVSEYWLVDDRTANVRFLILRRGAEGFEAGKRQASGWQKSEVFGRAFRLIRDVDPVGDPTYTVEMK